MLHVVGCPLPAAGSRPFLEDVIFRQATAIFGSTLSRRQINHIKNFRISGLAGRARMGRILVRLLALRILPPGSFIDMDSAGKPVSNSNIQLAFSHSSQASFALFSISPQNTMNPVSLDAEYIHEPFSGSAIRNFFCKQNLPATDLLNTYTKTQLFRFWTIYEAIIKTGDACKVHGIEDLKPARSGIAQLNGARIYWRVYPFMGHILSVAQKEIAVDKVVFQWIHPAELMKYCLSERF